MVPQTGLEPVTPSLRMTGCQLPSCSPEKGLGDYRGLKTLLFHLSALIPSRSPLSSSEKPAQFPTFVSAEGATLRDTVGPFERSPRLPALQTVGRLYCAMASKVTMNG